MTQENEDEWVTVWLRPIEFSITDEDHNEVGYCIMDATPPWSDCNRAENHMFRVADFPRHDMGGDWGEEEEARCVFVRVRRNDLPKLWPDPDKIWVT